MEYALLPIESVELDLSNPRIKQWIEIYETVDSKAIALALSAGGSESAGSSYDVLKESIRVNGGIVHPIVVNRANGKCVVIEGNTRLQIYKEFAVSDPDGPWTAIPSIVYDDMPEEQIHAIRLQSHMVGPRDWDPFSKAKYLHQLSNIDKLPMATIISYCGGKAAEIKKLIDAYVDMTQNYESLVQELGLDRDPRDFSKFVEGQNKKIKDALLRNHFTKEDFAKWVVNGNIDTAQNVRLLPQVLSTPKARSEFMKSNISNAMKFVDFKDDKELANVSMYALVSELIRRISCIQYQEVKSLQYDPKYEEKKDDLNQLQVELETLLSDINRE